MTDFKRIYHLQVEGKPSFITFNTVTALTLTNEYKDIILKHILFENGRRFNLFVAIVMPDHVHMIYTALNGESGIVYSDSVIVKSIKGISAREINLMLKREGHVWQKGYFDHYIRDEEELIQKVSYVVNNPMEEGLVKKVDDYPWLWRRWEEGEQNE